MGSHQRLLASSNHLNDVPAMKKEGNTMKLASNSQSAVLVALSVVASACASKPPAEAQSPAPATSAAVATPAQPKATATTKQPDSPTASSIHIDDAILKACGITVPKAFFAFD